MDSVWYCVVLRGLEIMLTDTSWYSRVSTSLSSRDTYATFKTSCRELQFFDFKMLIQNDDDKMLIQNDDDDGVNP